MARAKSSRRAVDGSIQIRYGTDLTVEDYITRKAWWDASPPPCRFHPQGGCRLVPHGTYDHFPLNAVQVFFGDSQ